MTQLAEKKTGPKENLRATQLLCGALVTGIIFFAAIIIFLSSSAGPLLNKEEAAFKNILLYSSAGLALVCLLWAIPSYQKKINLVKNSAVSLTDKLNQHRAALIFYMAPCEGAAFFSVVVLFLTGDFRALIITAVMLIAMLVQFPFRKKIIRELNLDWQEEATLT
jgi:hypothetical protein